MSKQELAPITGHLAPNPSAHTTRNDGWTLPKQAAFLRALSASHSVSAAAKSVSMSRQSAYRLRSRLKGEAFDLAWEVAFHHSYDVLAHAALDRAINGVERPIYFQGEQVGSYRKYDERLTVAMLNRMTPRGNPVSGRLGPAAERHARDFDGLLQAVETGEAVDTGAPQFDEPSELAHMAELNASFSGFAEELGAHAERAEADAYYAEEDWPDEDCQDEEGGYRPNCAPEAAPEPAPQQAPQQSPQPDAQAAQSDKQGATPPCPSTFSDEELIAALLELEVQRQDLAQGDRV